MLIFNGKKYAKNEAEFVDSLFHAGSTCHGFYKRIKNGIKLYDMQHQLQAFVVVNDHGERFVVTASNQGGKDRYMLAASSSTGKWLGIEGLTFAAERAVINNALETI